MTQLKILDSAHAQRERGQSENWGQSGFNYRSVRLGIGRAAFGSGVTRRPSIGDLLLEARAGDGLARRRLQVIDEALVESRAKELGTFLLLLGRCAVGRANSARSNSSASDAPAA